MEHAEEGAVTGPDDTGRGPTADVTSGPPGSPSCPACGAAAAGGDRYCESCGAELAGVELTGATPHTQVLPDASHAAPPVGQSAPASEVPGPAAPAASQPPAPASEVPGPASEGPGTAAPDTASSPPAAPVGAAPRACPACGGAIAPDGYCETCGSRAPRERDHLTTRPSSWVAAVCDRGIRHQRNEDAVAVHSGEEPAVVVLPGGAPSPGRAVLVVCDGVTTSANSDVASLAAARAACEQLLRATPPPTPPPARSPSPGSGPTSAPGHDPQVALALARIEVAGAAANAAVIASAREIEHRNPPSCTLVVAVLEDGLVAVGSVGDSRAYWVPDEGWARQLTTDDSWAAERIAMGIPREEAEQGRHAHAITRWLGMDAPDTRPRTVWMRPDRAGWVLVCSDGLWNYRSEAEGMGALVHELNGGAPDTDPLRLAEDLVAWANAQGGHDNITVALARVAGPATPGGAPETETNVTTVPLPVGRPSGA